MHGKGIDGRPMATLATTFSVERGAGIGIGIGITIDIGAATIYGRVICIIDFSDTVVGRHARHSLLSQDRSFVRILRTV